MELKQRRRQRLVKNELYLTSEIRDCLDLFGMPLALETCYSYIWNDSVQFQIEIRKISFRGPRFVDNAELGHFALLFCRGRQRIVQKLYNTRAQPLFCSLNLLFGDVLVAVVVVVCLSSLIMGMQTQYLLNKPYELFMATRSLLRSCSF